MANESKLESLFQDFLEDQRGNTVSRFAVAALQATIRKLMAEERSIVESAMQQQITALESMLRAEQEENKRLGGLLNGDDSK